jgi:hypothetical protein
MGSFDFLPVLSEVIDAFEAHGIAYHIGGSVASSALGAFRTTMDVDLVADIRAGHAEVLVESLQPHFYIETEDILQAIAQKSSFNVIHTGTGYKVDVFVLRSEPYDREAFLRADLLPLDDAEDARVFFVGSSEDTVLSKLRWFRMGGETSERQWLDVQGVLKVQAEALDLAYVRKWASEIGVADLLERAISEAGITS